MTETEVWLYGSSARGDWDSSSDVDLLVVGDGAVDLQQLHLPSRDCISLARYAWPEIEQMAAYGSLFLHHVRLEGRPLVEGRHRRLQSTLASLGSYRRAEQELGCFRRVLADVEESLHGDHSPDFELAVVATAARHAVILGCYLMGEPDFGRRTAFQRLLPRLGYPPEFVDEVVGLYAYRQAENAGRALELGATANDVRRWVLKIQRILDEVEAMVR